MDAAAAIDAQVDRVIREGLGSIDGAPPAGDVTTEQLECPHAGCDWVLRTVRSVGGEIVDMRGTLETERLCQRHLEEHLDPAVRAVTPSCNTSVDVGPDKARHTGLNYSTDFCRDCWASWYDGEYSGPL